MAVARWVEVMDKDVLRVQEDHKAALRQLEIEKFIEMSGQGGMSYGIVDSFLSGQDV